MAYSSKPVSSPFFAVVVALLLSLSVGALAQTAGSAGTAGTGTGSSGLSGPAPGTNSAGTAQSSDGARGPTTGLGSGNAVDAVPRTGDATVDAQERAVDRKVKSICKGC